MRLLAAAMIVSGLVLTISAAPQGSELTEVLARAADYHARYRVRVSGTSIDEQIGKE